MLSFKLKVTKYVIGKQCFRNWFHWKELSLKLDPKLSWDITQSRVANQCKRDFQKKDASKTKTKKLNIKTETETKLTRSESNR
jgi:hypothetical protein